MQHKQIEMPSMLLIGAAGRNVGKTELACALIRKFRGEHQIVALKVTAIDERNGQCPRGGEGCGVCTSLDGDFLLTEETDHGGGKDTERMAAARPHKVYWLRVDRKKLREGIAALMEKVSPKAMIVCESNTLRTAVKPALFLMLRADKQANIKATAKRVWDLADRIVVSDGQSFDLDIDDVTITDGAWRLPDE